MTSNSTSEGWMTILRADIKATGSINKTAQRIGVSRTALSQILNGCGPYGSGKASTARVEEKVMNTIGLVTCPFLSEYHGTEHRITGLQCREHAYRINPPTNVPREMQHWRACQNCEKRVKPGGIAAALVFEKPARKIGRVGPVNNEIYCQADSGTAAETEGWNTMGGPNDNPYPVADARSDYWEKGRSDRIEFDRKERAKRRERFVALEPASNTSAATFPAGCGAAHHEGYNCIGGLQDNPYTVHDARHDYWENGYNARRVADMKQRKRMRESGEEPQQAGVIDKRTLPLPVVGGPQVEGVSA